MDLNTKTSRERRLQRARILRQERHLLSQFGVLHTQNESVNLTQWRARQLSALHARLTLKASLCRVNAQRAADIVRHGTKSRWWFARHSTNHAGSDTRGILFYLLRWRDEGRALAPVIYQDLRDRQR